MSIIEQDLVASYVEARGALIPLTESLREPKTKLKIHDLNTIFEKSVLWEQQKTGSGHQKFCHKVTQIVVEYQGHSSKKDRCISLKIQTQILNQVQEHLNILHDRIFLYPEQGWKTLPNFEESLKRV